jgi:4-amino-4-deoxy-L-arabinose transferase-like glycosyltransferase
MKPISNLQSPASTLRQAALPATLLLFTFYFVSTAAANLGNYWPVTADDVWIISASYKWATQGVFGSDLYAGFFNAERYYFIALPVQYLLQALAFRLAGPSIEAARWVTLAAGITVLWTTIALAWRWYGAAAAFFSALLLLFWRSGLTGSGSIPLLHLSRTARYDLTAVALMWLAILLGALWLEQPSRRWALAAGLSAALALLTQFFGAAVVPVLAAIWLWTRARQKTKQPPGWMAFGFLLPLLPYALYLQRHWSDAVGQTLYLVGFRLPLSLPILLQNLTTEWQRFDHLPQQAQVSAGPWLFLLLIPALLHLIARLHRHPRQSDAVLALALAMVALFLAFIDTTKVPLYAAPLLPALCLLLGRFLGVLFDKLRTAHRSPLFSAAAGLLLVALLIPVAEGVAFHVRQRHVARTITPYQQIAEQIRRALPPEARAAGSERWWWQLRNTPYLALNTLWLDWEVARDNGQQPSSFGPLATRRNLTHLIVNDNIRGDIIHRDPALQAQFQQFLTQCTTLQQAWQDPTYGLITLHHIHPACNNTISNLHSPISNPRSP